MTTPAVSSRVSSFGGRRVRVVERPGVDPAILLLGGCGVPSYQWDQVITGLGERTTITLDRPGLLDTPWPGVLPRLATEVATLADLVAELGRPVVLVAHSMAGPHAEAYARLHPDGVAGLVLVDGSVDWDPRPPRHEAAWLSAARLAHRLTAVPPLGMLGSLGDRVIVSLQSDRRVSHPVRGRARRTFRNRETIASVVAEQAAYERQMWDLAQLRGRTDAPQVPTVILAATKGVGARWVPCQRRLAELLAGRLVELPESRHLVMLDDPQAICRAIDDVATAASP